MTVVLGQGRGRLGTSVLVGTESKARVGELLLSEAGEKAPGGVLLVAVVFAVLVRREP